MRIHTTYRISYGLNQVTSFSSSRCHRPKKVSGFSFCKINSNHIVEMHPSNSFLLRDDELDERYNFSGATLAISDEEATQNLLRHRSNISDMEKSAILTGSDVTSPIHVASAYKEIKSTTDTPLDDGTFICGPGGLGAPKPTKCPETDEFFCFRPGQFEKAVSDCVNVLLRPANDTNIIGSWLLTDVSHWDHDRERVFILTSKTLVDVKYDFIALKILQSNKVKLNQIDTIIQGKLTYPQTSLVPRIEGIANGLTSLICGKLLCQSQSARSASPAKAQPNPLTVAQRFDFSCFKPVERSELGLRILWNKGRPISLLTSWNPFAGDIPWRTIKNHPILLAKNNDNMSVQLKEEFNSNRHIYSAESFYETLRSVFSNANPDGVDFNCDFKEGPILMENYVGVGAIIHNKHNFGFFKVRGKLSF